MISPMTGPHETKSSDSENAAAPDELKCWDCNVNFISEYHLNNHLLHHVKQPSIQLTRVPETLKITLKSTDKDNNSFEVVQSPTRYNLNSPQFKDILLESGSSADESKTALYKVKEEETSDEETEEGSTLAAETEAAAEEKPSEGGAGHEPFPSDLLGENGLLSSHDKDDDEKEDATSDYGSIPGAEPTPPPESSPEFPKIRIKAGLLKESLTITEITDENPNGDPTHDRNNGAESIDSNWSGSSSDDPLGQMGDNNGSDGSLISSLISNNYDRAKDLGFTTSDSEYMPLERFDDRNRNAMQVYSTAGATANSQNTLTTLAGLPMQQLAEQVSRLQPNNGTMHQQNVLINIQQFQQPPPPQHGYQPPPMYGHPPHAGVPPQPMYHQPYQYQPPNPMYYPPGPGYAPHMPPPRPPMGQQQMPQQAPQQMGQPYRQQAPPRQPGMPQRQPMQPQQVRGQVSGQRHPPPRQMAPRQRAPMLRPRGPVPMPMRGGRPRMATPPNNQQQQMQQRVIKRSPEQLQALQSQAAKRKRMENVFGPDKHDDADCEVISVQPKNTGLPQIQSVQGNAPEPGDNSVMHLSDSITLSVRNPPPRPPSPKKSDAKAVANILATRGITVTAAPKPKKTESPPPKKASPPPPVAINLNSAVSIIPTQKGPASSKSPTSSASDTKLPTVDLTDDSAVEAPKPVPQKITPQSQRVLPFQCDLCPAKYPNSVSLNKHRQSFHKTGGVAEFGVPLIDLKQPGLVNKLTSFGIYNYIPLPGASPESTFALPVISATNRNVASTLGNLGVSSVLTLGPIRSLPRPQQQNGK